MAVKILKDGQNPTNTNSYLVYIEETKDAFLIDAPSKSKQFTEKIEELGLKLKYLILTHGHWDHILRVDHWREKYGLKVVSHRLGSEYLENPNMNLSLTINREISTFADIYLEDDNGKFEIFEYVRTPGHSYDSISLVLGNMIFCGDILFFESVGRTDLPGSKVSDLKHSIREVLYKFDDSTILLPGHGKNTTIGHEKVNNPFVPM